MAVNKVILGDQVKIDLSGDTATEADVMSGKTFHRADGALTTGTYDPSTAWMAMMVIDTPNPNLYGRTITVTKNV